MPSLLYFLWLGFCLTPTNAMSMDSAMDVARRTAFNQETLLALQQGKLRGTSVEDTITEAYTTKLALYKKDSLKILMAKLIGIQQLAKKGLLEKDLTKNPAYYTSFLSELKKSTIPPEEYQFLSRKMAFLTLAKVEQRYTWSKIIILVLLVIIIGFIAIILKNRGKRTHLGVSLTKQEQNIKQLIVVGKSNKEIATELFISPSTVKTHITNMYQKLNISSRTELLQKFKN